MFPDSMCLGEGLYVELFLLVLLIGCRNDKEKEPFWLKPLLLKQLFTVRKIFLNKEFQSPQIMRLAQKQAHHIDSNVTP